MAASSIWLCDWLIQQLQHPHFNEHMVETHDQDHEHCLADIAAKLLTLYVRGKETPSCCLHYVVYVTELVILIIRSAYFPEALGK